MATLPSGIGPIGSAPKGVLTPQMAQEQALLQRRLAIAQALQSQALTPDEHPEYAGMLYRPKYGGLASAARQIAQALIARHEMSGLQDEQANLAQKQYAAQRGAIGSIPGVTPDASSVPSASVQGVAAGVPGQPQPMGLSPDQATAAVAHVTSPNNPTGITVDQAMFLQQNSPEAWQKYVESQLIPTDDVRTASALGRNLTAVGQGEDAKLRAAGVINIAPNATAIIPGMPGPVVGADFTNGRAGGYDQNGRPVMGPIQGSDVIAQQAGQTKAAQEANSILPSVTMADGSQRPMWAGAAAGGGSASSGQPSMSPDQFAAQKQDQMQQILDHAAMMQNKYGMPADKADAYIQDQFKANGINPDQMGNVVPTDGSGKPALTDGLPSPFPMASQAQGVGQSTMDKELAGNRAKQVGDMETDINDSAANAINKKASNVKMLQMLPDVTTGPLAGKVTFLRNLANGLGVSGIKEPTTNQEFDKYAIQNALAAAKQIYGARLTNQDVQTQLNSSPGATLTEKANNYLIGLDNIKQDRAIQRQTVYQKVRSIPGADLTQFPAYFNQNYPDQGISAQTSVAPGAEAPISSNPGLPAGWKVTVH